MRLPLFPLSIHLFPGGIIPLRIFEPRYLRLLALSQVQGFGLCLLGTRRSDGQTPLLALGTRVEVIEWCDAINARLAQARDLARLEARAC